MSASPRKWNRTTQTLISYGFEARTHLGDNMTLLSFIYAGISVGIVKSGLKTEHVFDTNMTPSPRRWNRTTLTLISYGVEARTPDLWRSSGRH
ncbi:hypothetical protein CDAR_373071 [Caerostris darwini]|uniref:Uncharacterized protein n=1 Tax=Caerostris darwini TaxID=1538125 RepID=A0AAV4X7Y3_9ARAC|nr:hypothetical protein CDAR_373071 [Caerostris darwini]